MQAELCVPRFVSRRWLTSLGCIVFLAGLVMAVDMICCIPVETDPVMLVITWVCAVFFCAATVLGLRLLVTPLDRVWIGPQGVRITLLGLTIRRIPMEKLRSIVGRIREYSQGTQEKQIYTLYVYYYGPKGQDRRFLMERTDESDAACQSFLSHLDLML